MGIYPEEKAEMTLAIAKDDSPPFWHALWDFFVHTLIGTLVFGIIAVGAALIELVVLKLGTYGINGVIMFGLRGAEYGLFGTDLFLYGVFLWRTAKRTMKKL